MIVKSIAIKNYRSIKDANLQCNELTALVGPNGAGKSSFIRALDLFYSPSPAVSREDFYNHDPSVNIEIAVTFTELTIAEEERFSARMVGADLPVVRVLSLSSKDHGKYYGITKRFPGFAALRVLSGRDQIAAYRDFRKSDEFKDDLATATSGGAVAEALAAWEVKYPEKLEEGRDDGQFFGFENVARGYLSDVTKFLFIPAVRDAADDVREAKTSAITQLMDLVVRSALATNANIAQLKAEVQQRYADLTRPDKLPALGTLEDNLTTTLHQYYDDADVVLDWLPAEDIALPPPRADVRLAEDKLNMPVTKVGHGLQRAFILSLLQHLAIARRPNRGATSGEVSESGVIDDLPVESPSLNLILGIEEPELYQHPNMQRHFAKVLLALSQGKIPGVSARTQIIYATHSPLLVGIDRFDSVRRITRTRAAEGEPKVSGVRNTNWESVAVAVWESQGSPEQAFTVDSIRSRVATLMTPWMNEGFFADVAVLVEGEDDRAALLGTSLALGIDLESIGCAIIPCDGKSNLDRPHCIFSGLGIPTFVLWDSDGDLDGNENQAQSIAQNRALLKLVGEEPEDWPAKIGDNFACFKDKLEATLASEIGIQLFAQLLDSARAKFGIAKRKHALKNPVIVAEVIKGAAIQGKSSPTLEAIVRRLAALRG
ncbi:MAG TPA: ATP-dependent endonuclease [Rhizomicrobium sp.]